MEDKTAANKTLYQSVIYLASIFFGINQYYILNSKDKTFDAIDFYGYFLALLALVFLLQKKFSHKNERMSALARKTWHIVGDFCLAMGTTTLFSVANHFFVKKEFIYPSFYNPQGLVVIAQIVLILAGYFILSHFAKQERSDENKRIDKEASFKEKLEKFIHTYETASITNKPTKLKKIVGKNV